eukprot:TRINITY_DN288_c0_g1_i1.p1 TRINITY_DN288_c0_g1~~TRINITY_DN288_c0_g1_i1.p1  ORF type:complete len:165 (-),score=27.18 TRINITY_DN288_c0_g1_i1:679-1101(-)
MASSLVSHSLVIGRTCPIGQQQRNCVAVRKTVGTAVLHSKFRGAKLVTNSGPAYRQHRDRTVVCGLFGLGVPEVVVIVAVGAILFGPKKLPELGKSLGKTVKSFQTAAKEFETEIKAGASETEVDPQKPAPAAEEKKPLQ